MANKTQRVQLRFNRYVGRFYRQDKRGRWYQFHQIGNAEVAFDVAGLLIKMGCDVDFISEEPQDEL
jgi:hypothetical protein